MEQLSQQQKRRELIKSLLEFKEAKQMEGQAQQQSNRVSKKQIENAMLEVQIRQFDCQQILNYPHIKLYESMFCRYNPDKKAYFLCCNKYCHNHAIICGEQTCKCALDHHKCIFTSIEYFCDQIERKVQQPIPKQIELYFQVNSVIYEHMVNRISQERQALMDWQQDTGNESALFLCGFNVDQGLVCHAPKVKYQKINSNHKKCCVPLQITRKKIREDKKENIKIICKNIHKKYSSMIKCFDQKIEQLQYHKKYANLNSAEFLFIDFYKNMNIFIKKSELKWLDLDECLKEMKIFPGHAIFLARKYNKNKFKTLDLQKFSINRIRRIWKGYSERIFRLFVEGKIMNELFCQMDTSGLLKIDSAQELRSQIDKIIQSLSQGQEYLFKKSILTKKLVLRNQNEEQLCAKLKEYKDKQVDENQIGNNRDNIARHRDVNFDQVSISNDRLHTALNEVETIKELGNLRNVRKLEIKWCQQMKAQVSMEILNSMPLLRQLALVDHCRNFSKNFIKKLCQFKQLTLFYINSSSHPQYYRSFNEDGWFIGTYIFYKDNLSIKELVKLTKLSKLQNIEISLVNDNKSAQVIRNMKLLRHLTLGYHYHTNNRVDVGLMKQLRKQRSLITLSLIGLEVQSKQVDQIITNNLHLKTIIIRKIDDNENISDGTVECMANLIQLQNLCIQNNTAITGKHLSKLDKLIMLEISNCANVSKKEMKEALTKMDKLQHLEINGNQWFDNELIMSLQSCKQIAYLNIQSTSVSCEGLKHLEGLTRLSILICGYNKIKGKNLIELTKQTTRITKLSITRLDVNDNDILQISKNCQALTHLGIQYTKITAATLLKIKQLKVVNSNLDRDCKKKLRQESIQTY